MSVGGSAATSAKERRRNGLHPQRNPPGDKHGEDDGPSDDGAGLDDGEDDEEVEGNNEDELGEEEDRSAEELGRAVEDDGVSGDGDEDVLVKAAGDACDRSWGRATPRRL